MKRHGGFWLFVYLEFLWWVFSTDLSEVLLVVFLFVRGSGGSRRRDSCAFGVNAPHILGFLVSWGLFVDDGMALISSSDATFIF